MGEPLYHPWRVFRVAASGYKLVWGPLSPGKLGETDHHKRTVTLVPGQSYEQRRSTIAHELEHIFKGYDPCSSRDECQVEVRAARKLIDGDALVEAIAWSSDVGEICEELGVDIDMLHARLSHLHPSELQAIRVRLENPTWRPNPKAT